MSENKVNIILGVEGAGAIRTLQDVEGALGKVLGVLSSIGVSVGLAALTKDMAMLAARGETLGVAMHQLGENNGYNAAQTDAYAASLRKTGISILESQQSVAKMISAHIDLSSATDLAREAQDAAVVGNLNSSEAFGRMVDGIQSGQVEVLRTIGINVNFEQSYKTMAVQLGKTTAQLSEQEKTQARVNAVLAQAPTIAGAYEAAMSTTGKQLNSLKRYAEDAEVVWGRIFGPAMADSIQIIGERLKALTAYGEENTARMHELGENVRVAVEVFKDFAVPAAELVAGIYAARMAMVAFNAVCAMNPWVLLGSAAFITIGAVGQAVQDNERAISKTLQNELVAVQDEIDRLKEKLQYFDGNGKKTVWGALFDGETKFDELTARIKALTEAALDMQVGLKSGPAYSEWLKQRSDDLINGPTQVVTDLMPDGTLEAQLDPAIVKKNEEEKNKAIQQEKDRAKASTDAWKKAFTDLKFQSADYYAYRVKQIDAETVGMRKAGVSAVTAEQWRNNELKQLDEERAKYEGDLDAKRIEAIKAVNDLRLKLHQEADEARKQELATLASINDYILQATDPQAAAIARVTAEYDRQVQAVMELHDTTTGLSDEEALAKIDALDRAHAANLRAITTSHEKAVTAIDRTWAKGFDRLQDLTGDWMRNQRVNMASVGSMMEDLVLEMVNTWAWGQAQMVFSGGQGGGLSSGGNILGSVSSLAGGSLPGNTGAIAGIYTVGKELFSPGSYAGGLATLQNGITGTLSNLGFDNAALAIDSLGTAGLSGWTAGLSTFGLDLLQGKSLGYSAGHGASAGGGAWAAATIGSSFGPVGTVVGAVLGSLGGGKLFEAIAGGGDDPWVRRWYDGITTGMGGDAGLTLTGYGADDPLAPVFEQANQAISAYLLQIPENLRASVRAAFTTAFGTQSWNSGKEDNLQDVATELANWLTATITEDLTEATKTALLDTLTYSYYRKDPAQLSAADPFELARLLDREAWAMTGELNLPGHYDYAPEPLYAMADSGNVAGAYQLAGQYAQAMDQLLNILDPSRASSAARALTQIVIQFGALRDQAEGLGIAMGLVDQAQEAATNALIDNYRSPAADVVAAHTGTDLSRGLQAIDQWQQQQLVNADQLKDRMTAADYTSWLQDIVDATKYSIEDLVKSLIQSWDEFANAVSMGEQSAVNPAQRYQLLGAQLSTLGQAALGGDQDAANAFQDAASNYLDLSRTLNTSAMAYAADSGLIMGWVNRIKQSIQVDTTGAGSTAASSLARTRAEQQEASQDIADLRQELIDLKSVMTAVVTQTQATSQILRRWDLGGPSSQEDTALWIF